MTLRETGEIFFGFTLFFEGKLDFPQHQYIMPEWHQKACLSYIRSHEHTLRHFMPYGKRTVIVFALLNQLKYRMGRQISRDMDTSDTSVFFDMLENYHIYFKHDIQFLVDNLAEVFDIYNFHVQKKIQWYTMPYVLAMLKFDKKELMGSELIKHEMSYLIKALKVFRFRTDLLETEMAPLQKKIDLMTL